MTQLSIILPARNEANNLERLLPEIKNHHPDAEIIVVDDGSTDATFEVSTRLGARCIQHPYGMGNGAAIKTGARHASHEVLVMMDADGQHDPAAISALTENLDQAYEMTVAPQHSHHSGSPGRGATPP